MKKYIKPDTKIIYIESLPLLGVNSYGDSDDSDTGAPQTKGNGEWLDDEDDFGW